MLSEVASCYKDKSLAQLLNVLVEESSQPLQETGSFAADRDPIRDDVVSVPEPDLVNDFGSKMSFTKQEFSNNRPPGIIHNMHSAEISQMSKVSHASANLAKRSQNAADFEASSKASHISMNRISEQSRIDHLMTASGISQAHMEIMHK